MCTESTREVSEVHVLIRVLLVILNKHKEVDFRFKDVGITSEPRLRYLNAESFINY